MHPGKKVAVLGLGKSGHQAALFLKEKGYQVFASEFASGGIAQEFASKLKDQGVEVETGGHTAEKILAADWVLISPGIAPKTPIYRLLQENNKPIFSEIEVASWFSKAAKVIAVTGSSGKTTVTTLIARSLEACGYPTVCCGNIGNPWIGELGRAGADSMVVLELSSFQLQQCFDFRPDVGVLLNISPNHLDWHRDMEEYVQAKLRMFKNQNPGDFAVIRKADQKNIFPAFSFPGQTVFFDEDSSVNPNEAVVRKVASLLGLSPGKVEDVLKSFSGIEHRLEKVAVIQGVAYVNDSKATTTASLAWALEKFKDASVHLIAGGIAKSRDYDTIRELIARKVKKAYLIGEAAPVLKEAWKGKTELFSAEGFRQAFEAAASQAVPGDTVLLSPACSSFDMFKNYQERGLRFKELTRGLTSEKTQAESTPQSFSNAS